MQKKLDGGPTGRQCRWSESACHQHKKCRWCAPWEVLPEVRECPPSTQKMSTAGPLGGEAGGPGAPAINTKNIDGGPREVVSEVQEHPPSIQKT
jgi:hypothetical protein